MTDFSRRHIFRLILVCLPVIVWTFRDYGITTDEFHHVIYGKSVIDWYVGGFREIRLFSWSDIWLYGGLYDAFVYLGTQISPLNLFDTRHLCNALMGLLGIIGAYRLGRLLGSSWAGVLAAVFLMLTPHYYGHAFNNHKDIPFAVVYLWSVYWQIKVLKALPNPPWHWVIIAGIVTGCAMGIRVGGVMLVGYAGLFWGLHYVMSYQQKQMAWQMALKNYICQIMVFFALSYVVMLIGWPWAQTDPLRHPFQAITVFSHFPGGHTSFFEGRYVRSDEIPWYYTLKWLVLTLPEFVLLGLAIGLFFVVRNRTYQAPILPMGHLVFSGLFPLIYLVMAHTPLYNATRQFLFVVPPLVILSAMSIVVLWSSWSDYWYKGLGVLVAILMGLTLVDMVRLHPFQSTYFNRIIAGGLIEAASRYDTDYYGNGNKLGVLWLKDHVPQEEQNCLVGGRHSSIEHLLDETAFVYESDPLKADYFLAPASGYHHTIIPGEVIHTISRMGVPLLYIIRPDTSHARDPMFANSPVPFRDAEWGVLYQQKKQWNDALDAFDRALAHIENSGEIYKNIGEIYEETGHPDLAIQYSQKAMETGYDPTRLHFKLGNIFQIKEDYKAAIGHYDQALAKRPNYLGAMHNLARVYFALAEYATSAQWMQKVIAIEPDVSLYHLQLGLCYLRLHRTEEALKIFDGAVSMAPEHGQPHFHRALALQVLKRTEEAEQEYLLALKYDPKDLDTLRGLVLFYFQQARYDATLEVLMRLLKDHPDHWESYFSLGRTYEALNKPELAVEAYQRGLNLKPDDQEAQERLRQLLQ